MLNNFKVLLGLLIVLAGFAYYLTQSADNDADIPQHLMPAWQDNAQAISRIDKVKKKKKGKKTEEHTSELQSRGPLVFRLLL